MQYVTTCKHQLFQYLYELYFMCFKLFFQCIFINFFLWKTSLIFVYVIIYCVGAGITTLMSISDGWDAYFFLSKDGKDAVHEGRNGWRGVYFPPKSAFFPFIDNMIVVLFLVCTLIWRVNNYVSREGKV